MHLGFVSQAHSTLEFTIKAICRYRLHNLRKNSNFVTCASFSVYITKIMKSVFLSLLFCAAMLLGHSRAAPTFGSLPIGGFPSDGQLKLVGSGGSGNGVHYQDVRCRPPASKINSVAPPLIRGLQAMSGNLSMVVSSIASSLNLTTNTVSGG